jgi:hypothetical protein
MAIADRDAYITRRNGARQRTMFVRNLPSTPGANRLHSLWLASGLPSAGVAPTAASAPDRTTTGAIGQLDSTSTQRVLRLVMSWSANSSNAFILADRLSHQGGLDGTVTSAQTTNLPTAALTRRTTGLGVEAWLEVYTALGGTTETTATVSYTNDAGVGGQTSGTTRFGGPSGINSREHLCFLPLASGDRGVRAVASVTLAASTGGAGNFGVTLAYPVASFPAIVRSLNVQNQAFLAAYDGPVDLGVNSDACLAFAVMATAAGANDLWGKIWLAEK